MDAQHASPLSRCVLTRLSSAPPPPRRSFHAKKVHFGEPLLPETFRGEMIFFFKLKPVLSLPSLWKCFDVSAILFYFIFNPTLC